MELVFVIYNEVVLEFGISISKNFIDFNNGI